MDLISNHCWPDPFPNYLRSDIYFIIILQACNANAQLSNSCHEEHSLLALLYTKYGPTFNLEE